MSVSRAVSLAALASFALLTVAAGWTAASWCRSQLGDSTGPWSAAAWSAAVAFGTMLAFVFVVAGASEFARMRSIASGSKD